MSGNREIEYGPAGARKKQLTVRKLLPFSFLVLLSIVVLGIFSGCNLLNPDEEIPAYVRLDSVIMENHPAEPVSVGSLSQKIVDGWIYVNDNVAGVYEMPFIVPFLNAGSNRLQIRAGILENGISANRVAYPFFFPFDTIIDFTPGAINRIAPRITYDTATKFPVIENFEAAGLKFEKTSQSDTSLMVITDAAEVFEGLASGFSVLASNHSLFEIATTDSYVLPVGGKPVYLELNYKCNNTFSVGIFANLPGQVQQISTSVFVNPTTTWKKIYINLTEVVSTASSATNYKIYIQMQRNSGVSTPHIFLDNIKVVHR